MRRKLSPWGWAAAGALSVLVAVWLGTTVYTAVKQRSDENRITHIEEVVVGVGGAKALRTHQSVPASGPGGGGALHTGPTGHQQSGPSTGGHGNSGGVGSGGHGGGHPEGHSGGSGRAAPSTPAPSPGAKSGTASADTTTDIPAPTNPAVEGIGASVGGVVKETGEGVNSGVEGVGTTADCALRGGCR